MILVGFFHFFCFAFFLFFNFLSTFSPIYLATIMSYTMYLFSDLTKP